MGIKPHYIKGKGNSRPAAPMDIIVYLQGINGQYKMPETRFEGCTFWHSSPTVRQPSLLKRVPTSLDG